MTEVKTMTPEEFAASVTPGAITEGHAQSPEDVPAAAPARTSEKGGAAC